MTYPRRETLEDEVFMFFESAAGCRAAAFKHLGYAFAAPDVNARKYHRIQFERERRQEIAFLRHAGLSLDRLIRDEADGIF